MNWIEITMMEDTERQFISDDGTQRRSEPFDDNVAGGDGYGWRTEFRHLGPVVGMHFLPVIIASLVAVIVSLSALVRAFTT